MAQMMCWNGEESISLPVVWSMCSASMMRICSSTLVITSLGTFWPYDSIPSSLIWTNNTLVKANISSLNFSSLFFFLIITFKTLHGEFSIGKDGICAGVNCSAAQQSTNTSATYHVVGGTLLDDLLVCLWGSIREDARAQIMVHLIVESDIRVSVVQEGC